MGEVIYPAEVSTGPANNNGELGDDAVPASAVNTKNTATGPATSAISGVIVDVRGTKFMPAMSPKIVLDDGTVVYVEPKELDMDYVINVGIAGFAEKMEDAKAEKDRIGTSPIIIKASAVTGEYKANAVISKADGAKILEEAKKSDFLKKCSVIFIVS